MTEPDSASIDDILWAEHRTVLMLGPVSKAVWLPPVEDGPGVLAAPDEAAAWDALENICAIRSEIA